MNKIITVLLISLMFLSCEKENKTVKPEVTDLLSIAYSHSLIHLQTKSEIKSLKNNNVKAIAVIVEKNESQKPDSTTFLRYDKEGRLVSRTTSECSSMGCLPYDIRQTFIYSNDTLVTMNDYFFKYKKKSILDYWNTTDTSRLRFVYDEVYTYKDDTIIVDLMPSVKKYIKDNKGRITKIKSDIKNNDQYWETNIVYTDSTILQTLNHSAGQGIKLIYTYNPKKNCVYLKDLDKNETRVKWSFNSKGLPEKITYYNDGKIRKIKVLKYYFYK